MRSFVLHQCDTPRLEADHHWETVNTDVLEILPAELVSPQELWYQQQLLWLTVY